MLKTVSKALNFTYTVVNPADGKWGHIEADGTWSGLVADAATGSVDFVISDVFVIYLRQQVFDGTVTFDKDFMAFVAPLPQPLPKFLALIQPFHYYVWFALVSSVIVTAMVLNAVAKGEEKIMGTSSTYNRWDMLRETSWYCFGTMLMKSPTEEKSHHTHALR